MSYGTKSPGDGITSAWANMLETSQGLIDAVGLRPHEAYDYVIFKDGATYYRRDCATGEVDDSDGDAATLINNTILAMPHFGSLRVKGTIPITAPITFDGSVLNQAQTYMDFTFDRFTAVNDTDVILIKDMERPLTITGKELTARDIAAHTSALIKFEGVVSNCRLNVGYLAGEQVNGLTIALEWGAGTDEYFVNNRVNFGRHYKVKNNFYCELTDNAWASINKIHLGWFEGSSPRQLHIVSQDTASFHHNTISGCGGATGTYNPQAYAPRWVIKLETDDAGAKSINSTTFDAFRIYSASDEIYRSDSGVWGTCFFRGMPQMDQTTWWHDGGTNTSFIGCETTDARDHLSYSKFGGMGQTIEHHVGDDTLTTPESGTVHTNLGAGGNIKLTLPQWTYPGDMFEFVVMENGKQLQVEAGAAGAIYINGAKSADDVYIWADDEGESVKLVADGNGDWVALYTQGTWTVV